MLVNLIGDGSGAEESLLVLLAALDRERHTPHLAAPPGDLSARAVALGVPWHPLPEVRPRRREPLRAAAGLLRAAVGLRAALAASGAALVHANSGPALLAATLVAGRRPLLWHCRDLRWPRPVRWAARRAAGTIAISTAVAAELVGAGVPPDRLRMIPNALDPAACRPRRSRAAVRAELGLAADAEVVLAVGQLVPWKRPELLLAAGRQLADRPRLRLLWAGADRFGEHPAWVAQLQAAAAASAGRFVLLGQRRDVPDLLGAADLLALPSAAEPFGRVLLEAAAVGLPVVATAAGGAPEVVQHQVSGLLVPPDDPTALAGALRRLLDDRTLATALATAATTRLRRDFAPARHAAAVQSWYDALLTTAPRQ
ncbi:MAG: glycosyltransferase family 4 protein [Fimbriimonadaceae bacterium]|nr:glycosyltransferase family 4 protein [Fimbriimonadaceae bacterium]